MRNTRILWCQEDVVKVYEPSQDGQSFGAVTTGVRYQFESKEFLTWLEDNTDICSTTFYILADREMEVPEMLTRPEATYSAELLKMAIPSLFRDCNITCYVNEEVLFQSSSLPQYKEQEMFLVYPTVARSEVDLPKQIETNVQPKEKSPVKAVFEALHNSRSSGMD